MHPSFSQYECSPYSYQIITSECSARQCGSNSQGQVSRSPQFPHGLLGSCSKLQEESCVEKRFTCFHDIFQVRLLLGQSSSAHAVAESYPQGEFATADEAAAEGQRLLGQRGQCWLDAEQGKDTEALVHLDMPQVQNASVFPIVFFAVCCVVCGAMGVRFTQLEKKAMQLSLLDAQEALGLSRTHLIWPPARNRFSRWAAAAVGGWRSSTARSPPPSSSSASVANPVAHLSRNRRHTYDASVGHIQLSNVAPTPRRSVLLPRAASVQARPPNTPPPSTEQRRAMQPERVRPSVPPPSTPADSGVQRRPSMVASRQRRLSAMRRGRRRTLVLLEAQRIAAEATQTEMETGEQWQ